MTDQLTGGDKLQRIQIGNLPESATEVQLRALFLVHGQIAFYERPIEAHTRRAGAVAYLEMASAEAAAAIKALNGHRLDDKALSVSASKPFAAWAPGAERSPRSPQPRRVVTASSSRDTADSRVD